mmetsp:Transcript_19424/g.28782  ORF Transcript_19424/g.28782 Transcript_19424/m.28782 type:complete len:303 (+) Transcript_19424:46-954(+)
MSLIQLEKLVLAAESKGKEKKLELLRFLRKEKLRKPKLVMKYGSPLLSNKAVGGDEIWSLYEQVCLAAVDEGNISTAEECLKALELKFSGSVRVKILKGAVLEGKGRANDAEALYREIIKSHPSNISAPKRLASVLLGQDKVDKAIQTLNKHLVVNCGDSDSWLELGKIYLDLGKYDAAAFCYEELILIDPADPVHHCRLAEIYYTIGGADNFMRARKHFSQSAELDRKSARALHGICVSCTKLASDRFCQKVVRAEQDGEINAAVFEWASKELGRIYRGSRLENGALRMIQEQKKIVCSQK